MQAPPVFAILLQFAGGASAAPTVADTYLAGDDDNADKLACCPVMSLVRYTSFCIKNVLKYPIIDRFIYLALQSETEDLHLKYIHQFGIILVITFIAEALYHFLPFTIPAGIYGLILILLLLQFKVLRLDQIEETSNFFLEIMTIIFLPAAVGLIDHFDFIKSYWLQLLTVIIATGVLTIAVTGVVAQSLMKFFHRVSERKSHP